MSVSAALVDTDILSAIMRANPAVIDKAQQYLAEHACFTLSIITRYEILRGLKAKGASRQEEAFERFCAANRVLPVSERVIDVAAEMYADLYRRRELIGDADILIAATASVEGLEVVTNNEEHFRRIKHLHVANWLM